MDLSKCTLVKQGAEARIYEGTFLGKDAIIKERFSKKYRHPDLDTSLTKERLRAEAKALVLCKTLGVNAPTVYLCDTETNIIVMERLSQAVTVRDRIFKLLKEKDDKSLDELAKSIGALVAKIHAGGLIHGDITTSNIMVDEDDGKLFFIDFGLSFKAGLSEDKGVDLYVLERAFLSTHPNTEDIFKAILISYQKSSGKQGAETLKKFEEIRQRGRKRTMLG